MNPADIANKTFTTTRLREGYDETEVDAFLDEVEAAYTALLRRAETADHRLAVIQSQAMNAPTQQFAPIPAADPVAAPLAAAGLPSMESIGLLLHNAEKTAEDLLAKAKDEAGTEAAKLRVEGAAALQAAKDEAAKLLAQAQVDAATVVTAAQAKSTELEGKLAQLQVSYNEVLAKLKAAIAAFGEPA